MGLSRNKVAVPEGAAGTPPFWRRKEVFLRQLGASQLTKRNTSFLESLALLPQFVNKRRKLRNIIMCLEILEILEDLESLYNLEIIESLD